MSEHLRPEDLEPIFVEKEVVIALNGIAHTFSTRDTVVWLYDKQWSMLNHVIQEGQDGSRHLWFGVAQDDLDALHEAGITYVTPPHPTVEMLSTWWRIEMADLDSEMAHYEQTGEFPDGSGAE